MSTPNWDYYDSIEDYCNETGQNIDEIDLGEFGFGEDE